MTLLIDIGNTRTKWAVARDGEFEKLGSVLNAEFDECEMVLPDSLESALACCVGGDQYFDHVAEKVMQETGLTLARVNVETEFSSMVNAYKTIDTLGVDRWVAAIGARSILPHKALIIIDAGTAVTIDAVSSANQFEGGVILPGRVLMHDALVARTAGIASVPSAVESVIGTSTQDCVNSGALFGLVGAIERVVDEIQAQLSAAHIGSGSEAAVVLLCGGDADKLAKYLPVSYQLQTELIFRGLHAISRRS